jgi:hypothetical protein
MASSNLPPKILNDSAAGTRLFFDQYGTEPLQFTANDVAAAKGFFVKNGYDEDASTLLSTIVLKQAKLEGVPVMQMLQTIGTLEGSQISTLVSEILNNNRSPISTLGFRQPLDSDNKQRGVRA